MKDLMRQLFSISIEEAQGGLEETALRSAVEALRQIEKRAKAAMQSAAASA
ncbi:hypothetical protein [Sulfitobacter profundi]|uniref:hypothetical protein n=1 Tax=Sulfitobacter profundi TaxID=2679961 RepID=UPI0036D7A130